MHQKFRDVMLGLLMSTLAACGGDDRSETSGNNRSVSGLSGCSVQLDGYYYIAVLGGFTGVISDTAEEVENTVNLALDEINSAGGIKGRPVGYLRCDDRTELDAMRARLEELGDASPVSAIVGPTSSGPLASLGATVREAGLLMVSPWASGDALITLEDDDLFFRTLPPTSVEGALFGKAAADAGYQSAAVFGPNEVEIVESADAFVTYLEAGGATAQKFTYNAGESFNDDLQSLADSASPPDLIFNRWDNPSQLMTEAKAKGLDVDWQISVATFSEALYALAPPETIERSTTLLPPLGAIYATLLGKYNDAFGVVPSVAAAFAYDAVYATATAMELTADPDDRRAVADAFPAINEGGTGAAVGDWAAIVAAVEAGGVDLNGATGALDFDANGEVAIDATELQLSLTNPDGYVPTGRCYRGTTTDVVSISCQ